MDAPEPCAGPMNIGNPAEFTVLELAERVRTLARSRSPIVFAPAACDDPRQRRPDISLAVRILDRRPRIELDEGLARTIEYFRRTLRGAQSPQPATSPLRPRCPPRTITPPTSVATTGVKSRGRAVRPLHAANRTDVTAGA